MKIKFTKFTNFVKPYECVKYHYYLGRTSKQFCLHTNVYIISNLIHSMNTVDRKILNHYTSFQKNEIGMISIKTYKFNSFQ